VASNSLKPKESSTKLRLLTLFQEYEASQLERSRNKNTTYLVKQQSSFGLCRVTAYSYLQTQFRAEEMPSRGVSPSREENYLAALDVSPRQFLMPASLAR
jgi:hypothetical protein